MYDNGTIIKLSITKGGQKSARKINVINEKRKRYSASTSQYVRYN